MPEQNPPQESVDMQEVILVYRAKLAEANENLIIMGIRLAARDRTIAQLQDQLDV